MIRWSAFRPVWVGWWYSSARTTSPKPNERSESSPMITPGAPRTAWSRAGIAASRRSGLMAGPRRRRSGDLGRPIGRPGPSPNSTTAGDARAGSPGRSPGRPAARRPGRTAGAGRTPRGRPPGGRARPGRRGRRRAVGLGAGRPVDGQQDRRDDLGEGLGVVGHARARAGRSRRSRRTRSGTAGGRPGRRASPGRSRRRRPRGAARPPAGRLPGRPRLQGREHPPGRVALERQDDPGRPVLRGSLGRRPDRVGQRRLGHRGGRAPRPTGRATPGSPTASGRSTISAAGALARIALRKQSARSTE